MNNNLAKELILNFIESDWTCSDKKMIYNNDFDLEIRLEDTKTRLEDDVFKDSAYDDIFTKFNANYTCTANLYYNDVKLDVLAVILLCIGKDYIPLPVAANMIDTFYENEFKIAKKFSSNPNTFQSLLGNFELMKSK